MHPSDTPAANASAAWLPVEPDAAAAIGRFPAPLDALAAAEVPAIIIRKAYPEAACRELIDLLLQEGLLFAGGKPIPDEFLQASIPEGFFREGTDADAKRAWQSDAEQQRARIDIGTSLGYRGSDQREFFSHAKQTHRLFAELFSKRTVAGAAKGGAVDPIRVLYGQLQQLASTQRVVTAYEPDGRQYGPAIIRAHYGGYTYKPHFDSVRHREKRSNYAVYNFEHQFAGVLVLQNAELRSRTAECRLHRCLWEPSLDRHLSQGTFDQYARDHSIEHVDIQLDPGDLYFFNTRSIHEVVGVAGSQPRVVLASFIGYSQGSPEIFVWS